LFGWSNKKIHSHHFWATFKFYFFGPNLKIEIRGQICNFLKIYWGQIENFGDQNAKFEKNITMKNFEILNF